MGVEIIDCMPLTFRKGTERFVRHGYTLAAVSNMDESLTYCGEEIGKFTRGATTGEIYSAVERHAAGNR